VSNQRVTRWALAALGPVLWASLVHGAEPPSVNQLEGTVVFKEDGQPAAGVAVAMVHRAKGYLSFDDDGLLAQGEHESLFGLFPKRNGRYACQTVTDPNGHFVLRSFAAPADAWLIAAGDAENGYALLARIRPEDYRSEALRLTLEEPAYIRVETPKAPKSMQVYTAVGLAEPAATPKIEAEGAVGGAAEKAASGVEEEDLSQRVVLGSTTLWSEPKSKPRRLGPLPGGQRYRVTAQGSSGSVPYPVLLFERVVEVAPGETAEVTLEPKEGLTVTGRVTSSADKPLAKVNVKIKTADGTVIGGLSEAGGKYELRGVPAGTHTLQLLRHAKRTTSG
jgi:hypothetical protein